MMYTYFYWLMVQSYLRIVVLWLYSLQKIAEENSVYISCVFLDIVNSER